MASTTVALSLGDSESVAAGHRSYSSYKRPTSSGITKHAFLFSVAALEQVHRCRAVSLLTVLFFLSSVVGCGLPRERPIYHNTRRLVSKEWYLFGNVSTAAT